MVDTHNHNLIREYTYRFVVVVGRHWKMSNDEFDVLHSTLFSTWPFFFSLRLTPWHRFLQSGCKWRNQKLVHAKTKMLGLVNEWLWQYGRSKYFSPSNLGPGAPKKWHFDSYLWYLISCLVYYFNNKNTMLKYSPLLVSAYRIHSGM